MAAVSHMTRFCFVNKKHKHTSQLLGILFTMVAGNGEGSVKWHTNEEVHNTRR